MATYTRAFLKGRLNAGLKGKMGMLINVDDTINEAVRMVYSDVDFRSAKRASSVPPNLFSEIYTYPAPIDLKGQSIVDIRPQVRRIRQSEFKLTTPEQFDRYKGDFYCAVTAEDYFPKLLISAPIKDESIVISTLDSLTAGGGTWTAVGGAINLTANNDDYVNGSGSIYYDIGPSVATTAGFENTSLNSFDFTPYLSKQVFHYVYISNPESIYGFTLKIGSSNSDYLYIQVSSTNEGNVFIAGWNLLRFDIIDSTVVGSPDYTNCTYASVVMDKDVLKVDDYGYRGDHIWAKKGERYTIVYYSKYPWIDSNGNYAQDSITDEDFVVADVDEIDMIIQKLIEIGCAEVEELGREQLAGQKYLSLKADYLNSNPSEAKLIITNYYDF